MSTYLSGTINSPSIVECHFRQTCAVILKLAFLLASSLVLHLDATESKSYPGSGGVWYDLSGNGNDFAVVAAAYNSTDKYMDFGGSYGCAKHTGSDLMILGNITAIVWTRMLDSSVTWRTLFRSLSSGAIHQVIAGNPWDIGMYDNDGVGFRSCGYSQQSLPGYGTTEWDMLIWRWDTSASPYYSFSYNDTPEVLRGSITDTGSNWDHGICSIGAWSNSVQDDPSNSSQNWGDISQIRLYNQYLTDAEVLQIYNDTKAKYGK